MDVVGEAKNGDEALELVRKLDWDVAVLDFSMPGRSGVELIKEIKRRHPGRPVLVLSMLPEEAHAAQVFKAGGSGYITRKAPGEETDSRHPQSGQPGASMSVRALRRNWQPIWPPTPKNPCMSHSPTASTG